MNFTPLLLLAARYARLKALCFAVWVAANPAYAIAHDANAIADAIVSAVMLDAAPVFGGEAQEVAVAAEYAVRESGLRLKAVGDSGKSLGAFQLQSPAGLGAPEMQAAGWLRMLHDGARVCPAQPAAPLSGGCRQARKLADRRVKTALAVLAVLQRTNPPADETAAADPLASDQEDSLRE